MRKHWNQFKEDEPGQRFRDRYERNQQKARGWFDIRRLTNVIVGSLLVIVSVFFGWAPGPGMLTLFIGLGMIAGEFKPIALFLDWAEVKIRKLLGIAETIWAGSSPGERALIVLMIAACLVALIYGAYRLFFG